jgi:putative nucleotidyltransferase with HDIG domain
MTFRVRVFILLTAVAALASLALATWGVPVADFPRHWNALAAFGVLGFLSEASYLRLRVGNSETNASVAFIPQLASILLFDTGWVVSIAALSELAVEYGVRKKPARKIVFNVSQLVVSLAAASWLYHLAGGNSALSICAPADAASAACQAGSGFRLAALPIVVAVATYFGLNNAAVTTVVALSDEVPFHHAWQRIAGPSLFYDIFSSALAPLLALLYVHFQLWGILILVLPLFFVRHIYQVNLQLEQVNRDLLVLMVKAIEARDQYTSGHSLRVSRIAGQLARERGLATKVVDQITTAALLHDVGKIHEDFAPLLRKEARLDATEKALMQTHPSRSAELVATISAFQGPIERSVRHHHENYDGSGYPLGLAGDAIPIGARVIMLADTMDAMTTDRPYRKALTYERVVEELQRFAGSQFDPGLVDVAVRSPAIKELVLARLQGHSIEAAPTGLDVFARSNRGLRSDRLAVAR